MKEKLKVLTEIDHARKILKKTPTKEKKARAILFARIKMLNQRIKENGEL
jgi:hypothetical protein